MDSIQYQYYEELEEQMQKMKDAMDVKPGEIAKTAGDFIINLKESKTQKDAETVKKYQLQLRQPEQPVKKEWNPQENLQPPTLEKDVKPVKFKRWCCQWYNWH